MKHIVPLDSTTSKLQQPFWRIFKWLTSIPAFSKCLESERMSTRSLERCKIPNMGGQRILSTWTSSPKRGAEFIPWLTSEHLLTFKVCQLYEGRIMPTLYSSFPVAARGPGNNFSAAAGEIPTRFLEALQCFTAKLLDGRHHCLEGAFQPFAQNHVIWLCPQANAIFVFICRQGHFSNIQLLLSGKDETKH